MVGDGLSTGFRRVLLTGILQFPFGSDPMRCLLYRIHCHRCYVSQV